MFVLLVLMIGLRHEVGGDWSNYVGHIQRASFESLERAVLRGDPAYSLLNWIAAQLDLGPYFVNIVCAALFGWGLVVFCRTQPLPWLALVVAVPYLVTVVAMGYTRQGVAIGLAMLGLVALADRKILRFVVFVALAATFHKSAVILMPLAVLAGARNRVWTALWVGLASVLFYVLLLEDAVEQLQYGYLEREYQSQGAAIRLAMNAVPAMVFLKYRSRFDMSPADRMFWTWMSLGALAFVGLLVVSPSSTAVDRVALYWIPLQLFVLSRLPDAMAQQPELNTIWTRLVVAYSAAVLFVWLFFASHANAWLPYQFYPWVWFWQ
ncbi:EpsG family protein [Rhodoferax sp.]|nr:EpsG family protein [Rhodoferax sp.]MDP3190366.1 EpsG family protein [Rhodoferax sp.]MDP3336814.1 EpsG family protein [Rhodoferax sp.]